MYGEVELRLAAGRVAWRFVHVLCFSYRWSYCNLDISKQGDQQLGMAAVRSSGVGYIVWYMEWLHCIYEPNNISHPNGVRCE